MRVRSLSRHAATLLFAAGSLAAGILLPPASALTYIDTFDVGGYELTLADRSTLDVSQDNLPTDQVLGGVRSVDDLWTSYRTEDPAPTHVGVDAEAGVFFVSTPDDPFTYFDLRYGSADEPLGANLTAAGADRFRLRFAGEAPGVYLRLSATSLTNDGSDFTSRLFGARFLTIPDDGILELPFDELTETPGFFGNVAAIELNFVRYQGDFLLDSFEVDGPPLTGDFNRDGVFDPADRDHWQASYGGPYLQRQAAFLTTDANRDGRLDAADYTVWRDAYAATQRPRATPEPGTAWLALTAAASAIALRRGRPKYKRRP